VVETWRIDVAYAVINAGEVMTLGVVVDRIQRHIRNGSHVFQLSHDAFKSATLQGGPAAPDSTMLNVAMELAMQASL